MKKLGGSLDTSDVQFSFMNLTCYFLLDFGKDELMFRSQQLLLSNIHIMIAAKSQSVLLTQYTAFYPNLKKDILCPALRAFSCDMVWVKCSFLKPRRTNIFLNSYHLSIFLKRTLLRYSKSHGAGKQLPAMRGGRAMWPIRTFVMGRWHSSPSNLLWRSHFWPGG